MSNSAVVMAKEFGFTGKTDDESFYARIEVNETHDPNGNFEIRFVVGPAEVEFGSSVAETIEAVRFVLEYPTWKALVAGVQQVWEDRGIDS